MAKRIVTKIGDIFCAEFGDGYKGYFQYMLKDDVYLGGNVIRVFNKHYCVDDKPSVETIINDDVAFHAITYIRVGLDAQAWYKIGSSKERGIEELESFLFGLPAESITNKVTNEFVQVIDPQDHWSVRYAGCMQKAIGRIPDELKTVVECGGVLPYTCIIDRMKYGYYKWTMHFYGGVKRIPRIGVDSYVVLPDRLIRTTWYFHFHENRAVREVVVDADGRTFRLSVDEPADGPYRLYDKDFGEINWRHDEFITADVFEAMWCKSDKVG